MKRLKYIIPFLIVAALILAPFLNTADSGLKQNRRMMLPHYYESALDWKAAQTFTTSGTWYRPPGVERVLAIVAASGGGGGSNTGVTAGSGAAGGGCSIEEVDVRGTTSETVTVGTGGAGHAGGGGPGIAGGASSFGALVTATGGARGNTALQPGQSANIGGGAGGPYGTSSPFNASPGAFGSAGSDGGASGQDGGGGGGSYGNGGNGGVNTGNGANGTHGGGGGGAGGNGGAGGDGGDGIIIIIPLVSNDIVLTLLKYKSYMLARWISDIFSATVAIAGETKRYAEIKDGVVNGFHERSDDRIPVFSLASGLTVVEVTKYGPALKQGDKYDDQTGIFSLPDPPDPQIAIDSKILGEMQSAASRAAAIVRLIASEDLPTDYED